MRPLGFSTADRWLKRSGLDYWEGVHVNIIDDLRILLEKSSAGFYFFSSRAQKRYDCVAYGPDDLLIFGSETTGLPDWVAEIYGEHLVTIPMVAGQRCLNLATSVGIGVYEAWRQQGFSNLRDS